MENKIKNKIQDIYECSYLILTNTYLLNKNMLYKDKKRLIILYLTYPLLIISTYNLSISVYTVKYTLKTLYYSLFILLSALIINYFSKPELYFDMDDNRRYFIIGLVFLLFPSKIMLIINEYQLWHLLSGSARLPIWNFTL